MSEVNKELCRKAIELVWNLADPVAMDELFSIDYVHRGTALPVMLGREAFKQHVLAIRAGFPDG